MASGSIKNIRTLVSVHKLLAISCRRTLGPAAFVTMGTHQTSKAASRVGSLRSRQAPRSNAPVPHGCLSPSAANQTRKVSLLPGLRKRPLSRPRHKQPLAACPALNPSFYSASASIFYSVRTLLGGTPSGRYSCPLSSTLLVCCWAHSAIQWAPISGLPFSLCLASPVSRYFSCRGVSIPMANLSFERDRRQAALAGPLRSFAAPAAPQLKLQGLPQISKCLSGF